MSRDDNLPDNMRGCEARAEDQADEMLTQLPPGAAFRCLGCKKAFDYEPIPSSSNPYDMGSCYDCLSPETQAAYDKFEESMKGSDA
ncbi:MAG: hypothetical protein ACPGVG_20630 [Mycobacterium sp.]